MGEPWIRVHANLAGKPVVWRAVEVLRVSQHEAIGLLVQFWGAVSQHAKNGEVAPLPDAQIETWAGWRGKRGKFAAFIRSTHLDPDGRVNDWDEYAGKLEDRRAKERTRKQRERERKSRDESRGSHADSPQDVRTVSAPTIRNDTKRDEEIVVDLVNVDGSIIGEPALTALYLTIWANGAITEKWGEQPAPLTASGAVELADALQHEHADPLAVKASIYRQCRESKQPRPPRGVNYFRPGIEKDLEREAARRALAVSGETAPPREAPAPKAKPNVAGEAALIFANVRGLIETRQQPGQAAVRFIKRAKVEALGADVVKAYDAIGGADTVLAATGEKMSFVIRDFTRALEAARHVN